ncbi:hypothetical protein PIB30_092587 [Stylosanthes scabra]|uniref:Clathrin adaptor alpha-adaptin appendage C-terminal subdomain domain-containing protein n=1 Tax=Stylosanthes scabra TaxID=79078 RepID=A0ABU6WY54_9FABA|nr:hypothetical protein [Stylosanthes scabra]
MRSFLLYRLLLFPSFYQHMLKCRCTVTHQTLNYRIRFGQYLRTTFAILIQKNLFDQDQCAANGTPPLPAGQLDLVKMPSMSVMWMIIPQIQNYHRKFQPPPADILSDLLGPLAIEGTPSSRPIGDISERFQVYEDPYIQIGIKAEWSDHDGHMMELSLVPETIPPRAQVNIKLRLPAVLSKFLQPISIAAEEFFPQWRSLRGPSLKLQEVVRGVRPLPLIEMANLFNGFHLTVCPGLDPNPNNLLVSTTFYSESTWAMLRLIRIKTDPADRTQLRMTVASGTLQ